jgi:hypothetical protein
MLSPKALKTKVPSGLHARTSVDRMASLPIRRSENKLHTIKAFPREPISCIPCSTTSTPKLSSSEREKFRRNFVRSSAIPEQISQKNQMKTNAKPKQSTRTKHNNHTSKTISKKANCIDKPHSDLFSNPKGEKISSNPEGRKIAAPPNTD